MRRLLLVALLAGCAAPARPAARPAPTAPPPSASDASMTTVRARVTFEGRGRPLEAVLEELGRQTGCNLVVEPGLEVTVDLSLRDVSLEDALRLLEERHRLETRRLGEVLWITCPPRVTLQGCF
jgi:type II secretory pathway component HofQ